ncbi:MAG: hypothetical protein R2741_09410 [Methanolobus sp.]
MSTGSSSGGGGGGGSTGEEYENIHFKDVLAVYKRKAKSQTLILKMITTT